MLKKFISKVVEKQDLTEEEAHQAMGIIMDGDASSAQIASFVTGLRMKGETIPEITGFARAMRTRAVHIAAKGKEWILDTCGTGGDGHGTFNISTTVSFVAAGKGITVAKHGNRSVSSRCGSADVLEALGVNIQLPPERVEACLQAVGLAFLFAPLFHPAMKYALAPRKEMGIRTVFNLLGPLNNPAGANAQIVGLYRGDLTRPIGEVLKNLGCRGAFVVHGEDHCDEISITGKTIVSHLRKGTITTYDVQPEDFGLKRSTLEHIQGGTAQDNAKILLEVLGGASGPKRDVVLLNAGAAFVSADRARDMKEGIAMAEESIDSGEAMGKLRELVAFSNRKE